MHKRRLAQLRGALSRLPWKWIALVLCLAALAGIAYHYRHPLAQRFHQVEQQARSQLANTKAYIQGPVYKKARAWEHSLRQGLNRQRCGTAVRSSCACAVSRECWLPIPMLHAQAVVPWLCCTILVSLTDSVWR